MFRTWVFTEMPYPNLPPDDTYPSVRVTLPSRHYDPEVGYELYRKYYDIYAAADGLGLDIMVNEHHSTATCVEPAVPLSLAILARETKHARLLALGNPIVNRADPVRVAEEMAMVDVISRGRLEVGFVRSVPMEISPSNTNPVDMKQRFWEAADLIVKAWTSTDGAFSWETEHLHRRQVNVWPRVFQQPHPPVWVPTQSSSTVVEVAERQYNLGTILTGTDGAQKMFDLYRRRSIEAGFAPPSPDRLAYTALVYVGETDDEGYEGARKLQWFLQNNKLAPQFIDVPGYLPAEQRAGMLAAKARGERIDTPVAHLAQAPIEELVKGGYVFAGSPESVLEQLRNFYIRVGGFGNLLMMAHAGTMSYETTVRSMELFSREVLPRMREEVYGTDAGVSGEVSGDGSPTGVDDGHPDRLVLP